MAGVGDVPRKCEKCGAVTLHRPDEMGGLHCMTCLSATVSRAAPAAAAPPQQQSVAHWQQQQQPPAHWQQQQAPRQRDGIVMGTIKLAGFVVALIILASVGMCVYVCGSVAKPTERSRHVEPSPTTTPTPSATPSASTDWEPRFSTTETGKREAEAADLAQRAVYERCSKLAVWREGSRLDGTYVFRSKGQPEMVNVSVKLARIESVANGNTLWYRVTFKNGKPATFRANKKISADLCGLDADEVEVPL